MMRVFYVSCYVFVCVTALILALVFTGSYQSNSSVALLSGHVVYSVLLILLVTLWQNIWWYDRTHYRTM